MKVTELTYQRNRFLILMQNMNTALQMQTTETNSAGNALNRYSVYAESTEAKLNDLTNATQKMWINLVHSEAINGVLTGMTSLINTISHVTSTFGGLNTMLYTVIATFAIFKSKAIAAILTSIGELITANESLLMSLIVVEGGLAKLGTAMTTLFTNPITIAIALIGGLTTALISYANHQQEIKEQAEATTKAQTEFNNAIKQFQESLDPKKIDDVANSLENLKKAINYDDDLKKIDELKARIQSIKDNMGNDSSQGDISLLPGLEKELSDLEDKIKTVDKAQKEYDEQKKIAIALDFQSVESNNQKIASLIKQNEANRQIIDSYQKVYDKLSQGNALTKEESDLNQQMIDKYPQYTKVLNEVTDATGQKTTAIGIDIQALKANQTAQEALATIQFNSMKANAIAQKQETLTVINQTQARIDAINAEMTAIAGRNMLMANASTQLQYYKLLNESGVQVAEEFAHNTINKDTLTPGLSSELAKANDQLQMAKATMSAWDTLSNMSIEDLKKSSSSSSGSYIPDGSDSSKKSPTSSLSEQVDIEESLIRSFNTEANLTAEANKLLEKQIANAKEQKNYNSELDLTNQLIQGQSKQISQLGTAKSKIEQEFVKVSSESGFANTSQWIDPQGEATLYYQNQWNSSSVQTQKQMSATFDKLSKLKKAWSDNNTQVSTLQESLSQLNTTLPEIQFDIVTANIQKFKDETDELNSQLDLSKSRMSLTTSGTDSYNQELKTQISTYEQLIDKQKQSIVYMKQELNNTNLNAEAKQSLTKQIEDATKAELGYQQSQQQTAKDLATEVINTQKSIADITLSNQKAALQAQIDNAKNELDSFTKIHQAIMDNYDDELNAYKTLHQSIIDGYQAQLDALNAQNNAEQEELDRQQKLLDIQNAQLDLQKAQQALVDAENQRNTRIYVEGQGWTWQADPKEIKNNQDAVEKAQDTLKQTQSDYDKWERDTALNHQKQMLQDEIDAENKLISQKEKSIEDEKKYEQDLINAKQEWYDNLNTQFTNSMNAIQTQFDNQWKNIDQMSTALFNQFGNNVDKAVTVLTQKLKDLNSQLQALNGSVNLPSGLSGLGGGSSTSSGSSSSYYTGTTYNGVPVNDGSATYNNWVATHSHANGTENSDGGFAITSEEGPELTYLNKGSAVIPANFTKNIMAFGANPLNYMNNLLSNLNLKLPSFNINSTNINKTVGNSKGGITINTLNVTSNNVDDFISQLRNLQRLTNVQFSG